MTTGENGAAQQLDELLTDLSGCESEEEASHRTIEHAAQALESEAGAIVSRGGVQTSVGFAGGEAPVPAIMAVVDGRSTQLALNGDRELHTVVVPLDGPQGHMVLARNGPSAFDAQETDLLRAMGKALDLSIDKLRTLQAEQERRRLLDRLSKIQNSISHSAPLNEVLGAIIAGAAELLGEELAAVRVVNSEDRTKLELLSAIGIDEDTFERARMRNVGEGLAGRAFTEERLIVLDDYQQSPDAYPVFVGPTSRRRWRPR